MDGLVFVVAEVFLTPPDLPAQVPRPPFDDPSVFSKPAYMYREQEAEEHSEVSAHGLETRRWAQQESCRSCLAVFSAPRHSTSPLSRERQVYFGLLRAPSLPITRCRAPPKAPPE